MSAASVIGDSRLMLVDAGLRIVRVLVLLAIWRSLVEPGEVVGGFTLDGLLTYTLIAEVFAAQLATKSDLDIGMWEGTIGSRLQQPMSLVSQLGARLAGAWLFTWCTVAVPVLALSPAFGVDPAPHDAVSGIAFIPSLALSVALGLAADFIFAAISTRYGLTVWLMEAMRASVVTVLGGAIVPLAILPWGLGAVFDWLPPASMMSAPLRIYTGTGPIGWLLLGQLAWAIGLAVIAHRMWRANRERLVGYGG